MSTDQQIGTRPEDSPFLPWLDDIRPYIPGKPPEHILRKIRLAELAKLASNENPLGPSPLALEAIQESLRDVNRYPDDQAQNLKSTISEHFKIPTEQIVVGNGSNDLIELLVRITSAPGREVVMAEASFPTCRIATLGTGGELRAVPLTEDKHDLDAMAAAVSSRTHLVYVCNPNNPTGTMNSAEEVDRFLDRLPSHVLAVFDEAYFEYVEHPEYPDLLPRVLQQENVVLLRTFSKCYSLANLRIGYGFCAARVVERLEKVRLPFNANGFAQRAAIASLRDEDQVPRSRLFNAEGKAFLRRELERLSLFYRDSVTNFLMVRIPYHRGDLYNELLARGVVIRPLQSFGLPEHHYRVTVGTESENRRFVQQLEEILQKDA